MRNNDANSFVPVQTTFNKNFLMSRLYGMSWNLSRSLTLDFNATNYSAIDEPEGRITGVVRDSIWENLKRFGRTTDYVHTARLNYNVPINKIPGLSWITAVTSYESNFNWKSEPLITLRDPTIDFGNNIQNSRRIQVNPTMNFATLYNKLSFIRKAATDTSISTFKRSLIGLLSSIKNINGNYARTEGTFLPGYLPKTNVLGYDFDANAPGWGFIFGSQHDIRGRAISNGWVTRDSLLNQLYVTTFQEVINMRSSVEPVRDLRIELNASRSRNLNYSSNFKFSPASNGFESFSPVTTGDYSVSILSLRTAFKKQRDNGTSDLFREFENNRAIISRRLGEMNPNSAGSSGGYADGYNKSAQDVVVASFLAAYTGKDPEKVSLSRFPKIPVPNWTINYFGLTRYKFFNDRFADIRLSHAYRSTYNVNGFSSLIRYRETNGFSSVKDVNNNFLPSYQFSQIALSEQFNPLLGVDVRMKNNTSVNFEYRKSRLLSMSLSNTQLAQQSEDAIVFGMGFRTTNFRFPFGLFNGTKLKNDLNFKMDVTFRDYKIVIYRPDVAAAEISSGAKNITYRPSVDYVMSQRFHLTLFYDGNVTKPYTSQTFNTSFSNFGVTLRFLLQ